MNKQGLVCPMGQTKLWQTFRSRTSIVSGGRCEQGIYSNTIWFDLINHNFVFIFKIDFDERNVSYLLVICRQT